MIGVPKPWSICGYHSLIIVNMYVFGFICGKTMVNFQKGSLVGLAASEN